MAEDSSTDVLMMLTIGGNPIPADCHTRFTKAALAEGDSLLDGFVPGCFFAIEDMDLTMTAPAPDAKTGAVTTAGVQLDQITVTRQIDSASLRLMQHCIEAKGFDSATIIKRRAAGGLEETGLPYVRFDFDGVLIIGIDWNDSHVVKETITFITRGLEIKYRAQEFSGALSSKTTQGKFVVPVTKS